MKRWLVALALVILSCLATPAQAQDGNPCDPDVLVGETETEYICMRSALVTPRKALCASLLQVDADKNAISALDPKVSNEMFDQFESLSREQKSEFEMKALMGAIESGLQLTSVAVDRVSSLNTVNVKTAIRRLEELGADDPLLFDAMRAIAATRGKPAMAKSYADFIVRVKALKDGADAQGAKDNKGLRWALAALKLVQTNPYADLWVTGADFAISGVWYLILNYEINDYNTEAEKRLKALEALNSRLKDHVGQLRNAHQEWDKIAGDEDPRCDVS